MRARARRGSAIARFRFMRKLVLTSAVVLFVLASRSNAAAQIASDTLTSGWATFGQAVPQGAASSGLQVGSLLTQTDVKTRWPDGSIRFAVVSVNVPAAGNYPITAAPIAGGAFTPALPTSSVALTIGGHHVQPRRCRRRSRPTCGCRARSRTKADPSSRPCRRRERRTRSCASSSTRASTTTAAAAWTSPSRTSSI